MLKFPFQVDDECLITWLKKHHSEILYINYTPRIDNYARSSKLIKNIDKLNENRKLFEQKDLIIKIWRDLIGNAIVFLKSKDDRERFHDDEDYGVEKLDAYFKVFCKSESLFYGASDFYRDHISHMFRVFLLGEVIIKSHLNYKNIQIGRIELGNYPISDDEKEAMWCIISLTHDIGYGIGTIPKINKKTREMLEHFGNFSPQDFSYTFQIQPLYNYIIQFISSSIEEIPKQGELKEGIREKEEEEAEETKPEKKYTNHLQSKYYLKFSGAFERSNHGIMSCVLLMRNLVYFLESDYTLDKNKPLSEEEAKHFMIRREILRSIASHDCDDIYYLKVCDFSFLLTIIDEMQEWGRPSLNDLFNKKPESTIKIDVFKKNSIKYEIEIRYPPDMTDLRDEERDAARKAAKDYFIRKSKKIRRILRSAVDGANREFALEFTLIDKTKTSVITYKIIHNNPEDVKYYENSVEKKWQEIENPE